jgi:hypothetical protein
MRKISIPTKNLVTMLLVLVGIIVIFSNPLGWAFRDWGNQVKIDGWSTYTDKKGGYQMQYPTNWIIENIPVYGSEAGSYISLSTPDKKGLSIFVRWEIESELERQYHWTVSTLGNYFEASYGLDPVSETGTTTIDGLPAVYKMVTHRDYHEWGGGYNEYKIYGVYTLKPKNNKILEIRMNDQTNFSKTEKDVFKKIVDSIKIL